MMNFKKGFKIMFNGIIFNTGKIKIYKKNKKSILIGIKTKLNFKKRYWFIYLL